GVDPQQGLAAGAHPDLADRGAVKREPYQVDREQLRQPVPGRVLPERGDQHDLRPAAGGERGGQAGATRPVVGGRVLDHRHRGLGRQAGGVAFEVHVEQAVSDDDDGPSHAPASSMTSQSMWITVRCTSWTIATSGSGTATASSQSTASGLGAGPVSAQVVSPHSRPAAAAASTFPLAPLVDRQMSTSPGRPCARTCRAKTSPGPKSLPIAVKLEASACSGMAEYGRRSDRYRPTSSAVRCWASAAEPPLPQASIRPPPESTAASLSPQAWIFGASRSRACSAVRSLAR